MYASVHCSPCTTQIYFLVEVPEVPLGFQGGVGVFSRGIYGIRKNRRKRLEREAISHEAAGVGDTTNTQHPLPLDFLYPCIALLVLVDFRVV